jgi:hypothetical protein
VWMSAGSPSGRIHSTQTGVVQVSSEGSLGLLDPLSYWAAKSCMVLDRDTAPFQMVAGRVERVCQQAVCAVVSVDVAAPSAASPSSVRVYRCVVGWEAAVRLVHHSNPCSSAPSAPSHESLHCCCCRHFPGEQQCVHSAAQCVL